MSGSILDFLGGPGTPGGWDQSTNAMGMLGGMAGGLAQAAMPSRMPIPFGAALGLGAQGMAAGQRAALQNEMAQRQIAAATLNNQLTQAMLPAKVQMLGRLFGTGAGQPGAGAASGFTDDAGQPLPGSPGGAQNTTRPGTPAAGAAGSSPYLMPPDQTLDWARWAMLNGQDRAGSTLLSGIQTQAGGPGFAMGPNGTAFRVPGGSRDPSVIYQGSQAEAAGKVAPEAQAAALKADIANREAWLQPRDLGNGQTGSYASQGVPMPSGVSGTPAGGQGTGLLPAALGSLPDDRTRTMALTAAMRANMPLSMVPYWLSTVHNESGWNVNAPDGSHGEIGPGQIMPDTGRALGFTPDQLRDPLTNLTASASYFRQQWGKANGNPAGAFAGYNTGRVDGNAPDYIARAADRVNGWMGAGPTANGPPGVAVTRSPTGIVTAQNNAPLQNEQYETDRKNLEHESAILDNAQSDQARLLHLRDIMTAIDKGGGTTGALGNTRSAISAYLQQFMPAGAADLLKRIAGLPDADLAQQFQKMALTETAGQEQQALGSRGGFRAMQMFQKANPNLDMTAPANQALINARLVAHQMDVDYVRGEQAWVNQNGQAWVNRQANYRPVSQYDAQWSQQNNAQVGAAAMAAINGAPFSRWTRGLSSAEITRTFGLLGRADPTAMLRRDDGVMMPVTAFLPQQSAGGR